MNIELVLKVPAVGDLEDRLKTPKREVMDEAFFEYLSESGCIAEKAYDTVKEQLISLYPNKSHLVTLPHQTKQESYDLWVVDRKEVYDNSKEVTAFLKEHYKVSNLFFHEFNSGRELEPTSFLQNYLPDP